MPSNPDMTYGTRRDTAYARDTAIADMAEATALLNKISWGGVFAGALLALAVHLILNMLGLGIGAATIDPDMPGGTPPVTLLSTGSIIWWSLSGIVSAFAGGFVASRLSGRPSRSTGGWHGLTAWALSILVIFYMLTTTIGNITGGAYSMLTTAARGTTNIAGAMQDIEPAAGESPTWNQIEGQVDRQLSQMTGGLEMQDVRQAVLNVTAAVISQNRSAIAAARTEAVDVIAQAQNISRSEAEIRLDQYMQQASQTVSDITGTAAGAADTAANTVSRAAWFSAIALILGALAAWFGGFTGTRAVIEEV